MEQVFYTWVARSRSGSSSFTASAFLLLLLLLLQSPSLGIFRAPFWGSNAAPRQPGWHKASSPAFVYTWHDSSLPARILVACAHTRHLPTKNAMVALHAWSHSPDLLGELTLGSFTGLG